MTKKQIKIFGEVAPGFEEVKIEFEKNFYERKELGAACAVYYKGQKVVDLWGGYKKENQPWEHDTMAVLFSATKGIASVVLAKLHSEGLLDYEEKIATYWPEFAQNGKENITVKQLLSQQAGLVLLDEKLDITELHDFDKTAKIIARAKPLWTPGEYQGYQATTIGFYLGEIVRRVDRKKRTLGVYFHEEVAKPLGLDIHIGLPDTITDKQLADIEMVNPLLAIFNIRKMPAGIRKAMLNIHSPFVKSMTLVRGYDPNKRATWRVEQPSGNGIATARSLASLYGMLANGGAELGLAAKTFDYLNASPEQPKNGFLDKVMNIETRYGVGFMKPDSTFSFSDNPKAFGFLGATGSFAFADPQRKIGYAYITKKMGYYGVNDPREKSVREAMYKANLT
ncbi:serine hydrolase domain-containing protein [Desulfuribacillus alkaliarsenatis]|uniref:Beta-lactamase-related domain-containing protein n=1 Tax=Desulfuribacillus alkaliarsenatis TaxID=766136 RepID=A0A1E5G2F8_9FIRM|nr:serine hydrolase domain-containing protein [Desulfuribacillus alkaliarsenatis]OEF97165.1 hypothetical protein BHF68_06095 [Desulfuribacillus alkaliarsenatis]